MTETKKRGYTKTRLIKELSWKTELPQGKVREMLAALTEIACREARGSFVLPGLCKFDVVRRKARKIRNPRTGETLVLPERDVLRIVAARAAKLAVAPKVTAVPLEEFVTTAPTAPAESAAPAAETAAPVAETAVPTTPAAEPPAAAPEPVAPPPAAREEFVSFRCPRCQQEIEAPGDMAGEEAECPTCGNVVKVPFVSEPGTIHGAQNTSAPVAKQVVNAKEAADLCPSALKTRTIRIDAEALGLDDPKPEVVPMISFRCPKCRQEIEASQDMVGEAAQCPNCSTVLVVPRLSEAGTLHSQGQALDSQQLQAMKSRTMRINMPDEF